MKKSTTPLGLNGIYVGKGQSAETKVGSPTPPSLPSPRQPTTVAPRSFSPAPVVRSASPLPSPQPTSILKKTEPVAVQKTEIIPPPAPQQTEKANVAREEPTSPSVSNPERPPKSPPRQKSILKKPALASPPKKEPTGNSSVFSHSTSPDPASVSPKRERASPPPPTKTQPRPAPPVKVQSAAPVSNSVHSSSPSKSPPPSKPANVSPSPRPPETVAASQHRKHSPPPATAPPGSGKRDIAAGISRPARVLPGNDRQGSESSCQSSVAVGKTLRSQKMEARLRNASDDDRESEYSGTSGADSYSQSQQSYSTYADSTYLSVNRTKIYTPDTTTFGVGSAGSLSSRTKRILEKQYKLEGLSNRGKKRDDETALPALPDDGDDETETEDTDSTDGGLSGQQHGAAVGSGAPVVYYVMAPGGGYMPMTGAGDMASLFPPGYQFPPGFDPSMLSGMPNGAVGPDGKPLSPEAANAIRQQQQQMAMMQQFMAMQQQQGIGAGTAGAAGTGEVDPTMLTMLQQNPAWLQKLSAQQGSSGTGAVGLPPGVNPQTLAMAQQLAALSAQEAPKMDPLGIDLQTLIMAKQLAALNEGLKASGAGDGAESGADMSMLMKLLAQMSAGMVSQAPPAPAPPPPPADMSAMHETMSQMREMMLAMQQMQMQQPQVQQMQQQPEKEQPPPVPVYVPPPVVAPEIVPAPVPYVNPVVPSFVPKEPPPSDAVPTDSKRTNRELAPVLYRLVPHRSKFKRANELFEADVDVDYVSDGDGGSVRSFASLKSKMSKSSKSRDKVRDKSKANKEEVSFSLDHFAPPRNGGVGGDESCHTPDSKGSKGSKNSSKSGKGNEKDKKNRTSHFDFSNPLLVPPSSTSSASLTPRKSQDDFWIDPNEDDLPKLRRSSKDDLEIERKSSLLSLTSSSYYKKKVDWNPRHRDIRESLDRSS
jgi:hypothetical protein